MLIKIALARRRGVVVIVSANGTEDRGLESRQGERLLGFYTLQFYSLCT
jgi:hypothetical protein